MQRNGLPIYYKGKIMEARVIEIQEAARNRAAQLREFEAMHEVVRKQEAEKRLQEQVDLIIRQIPLRFRGKSFDDYLVDHEAQQKIKNIAMRYIETFKERLKEGASLILSGKPGTGKTMLSLIMYQMLARRQNTVKYESSLEWLSNLIQHKYQFQATYQANIKSYETVSFLVLDEITESLSKDGAPTEIEKQLLFQIINKRYENSLCTLVITNRDVETLSKRIGHATLDRLRENGISLAFDWDSHRK